MTEPANLTTAEGLEALHAELAELEGDGRREIAARIKTAREWGDLKENSEYHDAKNEQAHLETRIQRLREKIANAVIVEDAAPPAAWSASARRSWSATRTAPRRPGRSSAPTTPPRRRGGCRPNRRWRRRCWARASGDQVGGVAAPRHALADDPVASAERRLGLRRSALRRRDACRDRRSVRTNFFVGVAYSLPALLQRPALRACAGAWRSPSAAPCASSAQPGLDRAACPASAHARRPGPRGRAPRPAFPRARRPGGRACAGARRRRSGRPLRAAGAPARERASPGGEGRRCSISPR